ncbi:uncharacterized protein [Littorina saxatilis]|uniref:Uncharacterized protein n=1 Tax=Littorina saxatilis TaxID=31220 RepID=A0AAN9GIR1_9CAEN
MQRASDMEMVIKPEPDDDWTEAETQGLHKPETLASRFVSVKIEAPEYTSQQSLTTTTASIGQAVMSPPNMIPVMMSAGSLAPVMSAPKVVAARSSPASLTSTSIPPSARVIAGVTATSAGDGGIADEPLNFKLQISQDGSLRLAPVNELPNSSQGKKVAGPGDQTFFVRQMSDGQPQLCMRFASQPGKLFMLQASGGQQLNLRVNNPPKQPTQSAAPLQTAAAHRFANVRRTPSQVIIVPPYQGESFASNEPSLWGKAFGTGTKVLTASSGSHTGAESLPKPGLIDGQASQGLVSLAKKAGLQLGANPPGTDVGHIMSSVLSPFQKGPVPKADGSLSRSKQTHIPLLANEPREKVMVIRGKKRKPEAVSLLTQALLKFGSLPDSERTVNTSGAEDTDTAEEQVEEDPDSFAFPFKIDSVFSLAPDALQPDEEEPPVGHIEAKAIKVEDYDQTNHLTQEEMLDICGSSFVVIERLNKKDIGDKDIHQERSRCSEYCRKRTLNYLCVLGLIRCHETKKRRIKMENDKSWMSDSNIKKVEPTCEHSDIKAEDSSFYENNETEEVKTSEASNAKYKAPGMYDSGDVNSSTAHRRAMSPGAVKPGVENFNPSSSSRTATGPVQLKSVSPEPSPGGVAPRTTSLSHQRTSSVSLSGGSEEKTESKAKVPDKATETRKQVKKATVAGQKPDSVSSTVLSTSPELSDTSADANKQDTNSLESVRKDKQTRSGELKTVRQRKECTRLLTGPMSAKQTSTAVSVSSAKQNSTAASVSSSEKSATQNSTAMSVSSSEKSATQNSTAVSVSSSEKSAAQNSTAVSVVSLEKTAEQNSTALSVASSEKSATQNSTAVSVSSSEKSAKQNSTAVSVSSSEKSRLVLPISTVGKLTNDRLLAQTEMSTTELTSSSFHTGVSSLTKTGSLVTCSRAATDKGNSGASQLVPGAQTPTTTSPGQTYAFLVPNPQAPTGQMLVIVGNGALPFANTLAHLASTVPSSQAMVSNSTAKTQQAGSSSSTTVLSTSTASSPNLVASDKPPDIQTFFPSSNTAQTTGSSKTHQINGGPGRDASLKVSSTAAPVPSITVFPNVISKVGVSSSNVQASVSVPYIASSSAVPSPVVVSPSDVSPKCVPATTTFPKTAMMTVKGGRIVTQGRETVANTLYLRKILNRPLPVLSSQTSTDGVNLRSELTPTQLSNVTEAKSLQTLPCLGSKGMHTPSASVAETVLSAPKTLEAKTSATVSILNSRQPSSRPGVIAMLKTQGNSTGKTFTTTYRFCAPPKGVNTTQSAQSGSVSLLNTRPSCTQFVSKANPSKPIMVLHVPPEKSDTATRGQAHTASLVACHNSVGEQTEKNKEPSKTPIIVWTPRPAACTVPMTTVTSSKPVNSSTPQGAVVLGGNSEKRALPPPRPTSPLASASPLSSSSAVFAAYPLIDSDTETPKRTNTPGESADGESQIKRARLERRYPLPPGVVIKTEPVTFGYPSENDDAADTNLPLNDDDYVAAARHTPGSSTRLLERFSQLQRAVASHPSSVNTHVRNPVNTMTSVPAGTASSDPSVNIESEDQPMDLESEDPPEDPEMRGPPEDLDCPRLDPSDTDRDRTVYDEPPVLTRVSPLPTLDEEDGRGPGDVCGAVDTTFSARASSSDGRESGWSNKPSRKGRPRKSTVTSSKPEASESSGNSTENKKRRSKSNSVAEYRESQKQSSTFGASAGAQLSGSEVIVTASSGTHWSTQSSYSSSSSPSPSTSTGTGATLGQSSGNNRIRQLKEMLKKQNEQLEQIRRQRVMQPPSSLIDD